MKEINVKIVVAVGKGDQGLVMHVEDVDRVWPDKSTEEQLSLSDSILDAGAHIDDVFYEEHWDDWIPKEVGVYQFEGKVIFDEDGDFLLNGQFGSQIYDLRQYLPFGEACQ